MNKNQKSILLTLSGAKIGKIPNKFTNEKAFLSQAIKSLEMFGK